MRLAWLTPMSAGSGVSRFSVSVVRALSELRDVEVEVWHPGADAEMACPWAPVRPLADAGATGLDGYDAVIYNLGNHPGSHAEIYEQYLRRRGVVILHDKVMQDFFFSYLVDGLQSPERYVHLMRYVYGDEAERLALDILTRGQADPVWLEASARYPLFEPCLFNATGVVTHSREAHALVGTRYPGLLPTIELELPYFCYDFTHTDPPPLSRADLSIPEDRVLLVAVGRFGPQKRLDAVMRGLASDPDVKARAMLVVAGGGDDGYLTYLRELAGELGIEDSVRFTIDPDDETMQSLVALSDIAVNLRHPSTESASGSLIEQLYFRKPVIVSKVGVYDEMPDRVVVKIGIDDEQAELTAALRRLVLDADERARVVSAVMGYAATHFSARTYAEKLVAFAGDPSVADGLLARVDQRAGGLRGAPVAEMRVQAAAIASELASE